MGAIGFHSKVQTPYGRGIVQGWLEERQDDGSYKIGRILVSHSPNVTVARENKLSVNSIPGIWTLAAYDLGDLTAEE